MWSDWLKQHEDTIKHRKTCLFFLCFVFETTKIFEKIFKGSRDGAVVRALASHQCGPGSIPGPGVMCGLSLCWFSTLLRGFFSRVSGFPPSAKTWLLAVLQGHAWTVQRLPAAPIHAFGPTLSSCVLAVLCLGD